MFRPLLIHQLALSKQKASEQELPRHIISSVLRHSLVTQASIACTETAVDLIDLLSKTHALDKTALPEPWWTTFCEYSRDQCWPGRLFNTDALDVYMCAMVVLVANLSPPVRSAVEGLKLRWDQCLELLRIYQTSSSTALRCVKLLEVTEGEFWTARRGERDPPSSQG